MRAKSSIRFGFFLFVLLVGFVLAGLSARIAGQPAPISFPPVALSIQRSNDQSVVTWPSGLGLVQPQRATSLAGRSWTDFQAATTATNLVDTTASGLAFYRLRFLPPSIDAQPQARSIAAGSNIAFTVTATGTTPFTYQWRRNGTELAGQTSAALTLNGVAAGDGGDYTVVVANRAGALTSVIAALTITNPIVFAPPRGIYMGSFDGQTNGGFAALVRSNGVALILAQSITQNEGILVTNVVTGADGAFSTTSQKAGKVTGTINAETAAGTLVSTNGMTATFSAAHKADTGIHEKNAGFYAGTFSGLLSGTSVFILAADGTVFVFVSSPTLGGGGAFGKIDAANTLSATASYTLPGTTVPAMILIAGTLNPTTRQFTGTYSVGGFNLGAFSMVRTLAP